MRIKNPTPTPSVLRNPCLSPPGNLRLLATSTQPTWHVLLLFCSFGLKTLKESVMPKKTPFYCFQTTCKQKIKVIRRFNYGKVEYFTWYCILQSSIFSPSYFSSLFKMCHHMSEFHGILKRICVLVSTIDGMKYCSIACCIPFKTKNSSKFNASLRINVCYSSL